MVSRVESFYSTIVTRRVSKVRTVFAYRMHPLRPSLTFRVTIFVLHHVSPWLILRSRVKLARDGNRLSFQSFLVFLHGAFVMRGSSFLIVAICTIACGFSLNSSLYAAEKPASLPGIILITRGDKITDIGEIPKENREQLEAFANVQGLKAGYYYNQFGIFWLEIWSWDGQYCFYTDDDGSQVLLEASKAQVATALNKKPEDLGKPWSYTFPPGLMLLIAGGAIWIFGKFYNRGGGESEVTEAAFS